MMRPLLFALAGLTCAIAAADPMPKALDAVMIQTAVAPVKAEAEACGKKFPSHGIVKVQTRVAPGGTLERVETAVDPRDRIDPRLRMCVRTAFLKMRFPVTREGGSFGFPFDFDASGARR